MSARITRLRLTPVSAARSGITCGHVIVEIETDVDGIVGLGEMSDFQHLPMYHPDVAELERTLSALLIGRDVARVNALNADIEAAFPSAESLYDKASVIRCGIDIALWDLRAKLLDVSVQDLLGGRVRESLPIAYPIFRQQSPADVESNLERVRTQLARGQRRFRVYVGRDAALDRQFLERSREQFGDAVQFKSLDFSNLLDAHAAARFIESTRDIGYEFVEAPAAAGDLDGLRFVRDRTLVPVSEHALGPRSARDLVASGAVDILNVGLFVLGGITPALRALALARASGVDALIGTTQELAIGTAAAAHLGVCSAEVRHASDPVGPLLYARDVITEPLDYADSALTPPSGIGLGVTLCPDRLVAARDPLSWGAGSLTSIIDRTGAPSA